MKILSLDFETTWGLDIEKTQITEVGAVIYCTERKSPIGFFSQFVWDNEYPVSPPELIALTGIDDELLKQHGQPPQQVLDVLNSYFLASDYVLAHNGNSFDKPIYYNQCKKYGVPPVNIEWIDSQMDIPYPDHIKTRKLVHLAAEHGFINPFAHRALFDAMTTLEILKRYDIDSVLAFMNEKTIRCIAIVSFDKKDLAKARGYGWDPKFKVWYKDIKESLVDKEILEAGFPIKKMEVSK